MPEYTKTLCGQEVLDLIQLSQVHNAKYWFVYVWQRNGQVLYVGRTRNPYDRLTSHKIIGVNEPLEPSDSIHLHGFSDKLSALRLELQLLSSHKPIYNRVIPIRRKKSTLLSEERLFTPRSLHANPSLPQSGGESPLPLPDAGIGRTPETEA